MTEQPMSSPRSVTTCMRSWLESLETVIPDVSSSHESQPELL
jgi:hypothetical protein